MEKKIEVKPSMFVGSSAESLSIAYAIQDNLDHTIDVTVWDQGIFKPSNYNLESILDAARNSDFGAFVFSPDDIVVIRDQEKMAVRDNVIFELGIFIGSLGKSRSFIIIPRDENKLDLPSDLLGIVPLTYSTTRTDNNIKAALGLACNQIREVATSLGAKTPIEKQEAPIQSDMLNNEDDSIVLLTSWLKKNIKDLIDNALNYDELDTKLALHPGTTRNHIKRIAESMNLKVVSQSENMIVFKRGPMRVRTAGKRSPFTD